MNANAFNIVGAILGYALFRHFFGAAIGWFLGEIVRHFLLSSNESAGAPGTGRIPREGGASSSTGESGVRGFLTTLMALAAIVMKADGRVTRDELDVVKSFLGRNFPDEAEFALKVLLEFTKRSVGPSGTKSAASRLSSSLSRGDRLVLLQFLVEIAYADGTITYDEMLRLRQIASGMGFQQSTLDSVIAMFASAGSGSRRENGAGSSPGARGGKSGDEANDYRILEIPPSATDEEVKKAFRKLAMKHHPDRVATASPAVQQAAAEKFKKISAAYERISRRRGM